MKPRRGIQRGARALTVERVASAESITVSEERGVRYLHFGTEWVQGAMRVRKPWELELDYARHMMAWMLFVPPPPRLLQIGLGAGSLTKFVHRHCPQCEITVVENSTAVQSIAHSQFGLPAEDERFEVVIEDGETFVQAPSLRARYGVIQVDVFDAAARGPALDSEAFYGGCARLLASDGVMVVNLFGDVPSYSRNYERIGRAFEGRLLVLPPIQAGNVIAIAFGTDAPTLSWAAMRASADVIEQETGLNPHGWIQGLKQSSDRGLGAGLAFTD